jgi:hypothetical protein
MAETMVLHCFYPASHCEQDPGSPKKEGELMKLAFICGLVTILALASIPASAQVTLELYDNFQAKSKLLNPIKWFGKEDSNPGVFALESNRQIKTEPLFGFKGVDILNRSYASQGSDNGNSAAYTRLVFVDGSTVSTIQATVLVKKSQATGCSAVNIFATSPRLRIGGGFFNAGTVAPTPGDQTNDVFAFITVGREFGSDNPANVLDIHGQVFRCGDANCSGANIIQIGDIADLGTVKVNKKVKLLVTWDPGADSFVFRVGNNPEVSIVYTGNDDDFSPGTLNGGNKRLELYHQIPNCTSTPRPMAYMEAYFDNVMVNTVP